MISVTLPLHTGQGLNDRLHWAARARKVKAEREAAYLVTPRAEIPCTVTLTRLSAGELDDDNLRGSLKGCRDGVADRLGIDDADQRVTWNYAQERTKRGVWGVRIDIEAREP